MIRCIYAFVVGMAAFSAHAVNVQLAHFPPNPGVLPGGGWKFTTGTTFAEPPGARAWVNGAYGAVPKAIDGVVLAGRAGPLAVAATSTVGIGGLAAAAGRCLALANPACAVGGAAWLLYDMYRARHPKEVPGSNAKAGELDVDPGTEAFPETQTQYTYGAGWHGTTSGACSAYAASAGAFTGSVKVTNGYPYCELRHKSDGSSYVLAGVDIRTIGPVPVCPASIDPFDSRYSIGKGAPPGPDGRCPTARYNHRSVPPAAMAEAIVASPPGVAGKPTADWSSIGHEAIDMGRESAPADLEVSGPASQTGAPTTTTTTNGQGTTTTTTTPTYTYTYAGDTITYNITTTTVSNTVKVDGTTETKTEQVVKPGPIPGAKPDPEKDPCVENPERVGCKELGEAPKVDKPTATRDIAFSADTVGLPSGCPDPINLPTGHALTYTSYCTAATTIRPVIIGLASLSALLLVAAAIRSM